MSVPKGVVKDLSGDLASECSEAIASVLEIARIRMFQARFDDALSLLDSTYVLPIYELADAKKRGSLLLLKAEVMLYRASFANSGYDEAFEPVKEVEAMGEELADKKLLADAHAMRAWILSYRETAAGHTRDAVLGPAQASLNLRREIDDQVGIAQSLFLLAMVHEQKTEAEDESYAKAEELQREVLAITARIGEKRWRSYATRHLGWIFLLRGDLDDALPYFEESLRLRQEIGLRAFVAQAHYALGVAHLERGELGEAVAYCRRAYDLATELANHRTRFYATLSIAEAYEKRGDWQAALGSTRRGLEIAESTGADAWIESAKEMIARLEKAS